ncbi:hypothetical protein C8Q76DRAFT_71886 [Earliella scabrosa]|nr:hypothetical protein C8Q76DRAFT_71886 [Earliella scabrosa]
MSKPFLKVQLVSLFTESLVFGALTVQYCISTWVLLRRTRSHLRISTTLVAVSTVLWLLSLVHVTLSVRNSLRGFLELAGDPNRTTAFFSRLSEQTQVAKSTIFVTSILIGDAFLTYRLWVVWNRSWMIIIVPIGMLLGTAISGYSACRDMTRLRGEDAEVLPSTLLTFLTVLFSLPLATNLLLTGLIAGRIAWSRYTIHGHRQLGRSYWDVIETLVESAVITSCALMALLVTYLTRSNGQYIVIDLMPSLVGFVFTLIIILVHARERNDSSAVESTTAPRYVLRGMGDRGRSDAEDLSSIPLDEHYPAPQVRKSSGSSLAETRA